MRLLILVIINYNCIEGHYQFVITMAEAYAITVENYARQIGIAEARSFHQSYALMKGTEPAPKRRGDDNEGDSSFVC